MGSHLMKTIFLSLKEFFDDDFGGENMFLFRNIRMRGEKREE
jgi:hypothetical protein